MPSFSGLLVCQNISAVFSKIEKPLIICNGQYCHLLTSDLNNLRAHGHFSSVDGASWTDIIDPQNSAFDPEDHAPILNSQARLWSALQLLHFCP